MTDIRLYDLIDWFEGIRLKDVRVKNGIDKEKQPKNDIKKSRQINKEHIKGCPD